MFIRYISIAAILFFSCKSKDAPTTQTSGAGLFQTPTDHLIEGKEVAKQQMRKVLSLYTKPFSQDSLIKDSVTAVAIAEPILFNIYGKDQILSERPYEVYLFDSLWYVTGTIPKDSNGGGFEIIINSKNGGVMSLTHYK